MSFTSGTSKWQDLLSQQRSPQLATTLKTKQPQEVANIHSSNRIIISSSSNRPSPVSKD